MLLTSYSFIKYRDSVYIYVCVCVCMCKQDSTLNDQLVLMYHKTHKTSVYSVMVIVVGNEHGDTSSNPGRD